MRKMSYYDNLKEIRMFKTEPKSYHGCDKDIACAIQRGEDILCDAWNGDGIEAIKTRLWISGYIHGTPLPYISTMGVSWLNAEPVETRTYRKKASEIIAWLEDNGYRCCADGIWYRSGHSGFNISMYHLCDTIHDPKGLYQWLPEWLEER